MITIDRKHQLFRMDTPHTTYVCGLLDGKYLTHLYYGKRLRDGDLSGLFYDPDAFPAPDVLPREKAGFLDGAPFEYGTSGVGDFRENGWLDAVEIAGKDKKEAFVLAVQVLTQPNQKSTRLYLQGLDPAASYEAEGKVFPGDLLMQAGYPLQHVVHDLDARILWLRRVEA